MGNNPGILDTPSGTGLSAIPSHDLLANLTGASAVPIANTLSDLLDTVLGSSRGEVIYRNASSWAVLAPGTAGQLLQTGGAAADPSWTNAPSGTVPSVADGHLLANTSGGAAAPVDTALSGLIDYALGSTRGAVLYRGASGWAVLAPGTAGYLLTSQGSGADPHWAAASGGGGGSGDTPADDSLFSWINQGSAAVGSGSDLVRMTCPSPGAADALHLRVVGTPGAHFTVTGRILPNHVAMTYLTQALAVRDSGTGKIISFGLTMDPAGALGGAGPWAIGIRRWNSASSLNSTPRWVGPGWPNDRFRMVDDGTNLTYQISRDGANWYTVLQETSTAWLATRDQIGWGVNPYNSSGSAWGADASLASWVASSP